MVHLQRQSLLLSHQLTLPALQSRRNLNPFAAVMHLPGPLVLPTQAGIFEADLHILFDLCFHAPLELYFHSLFNLYFDSLIGLCLCGVHMICTSASATNPRYRRMPMATNRRQRRLLMSWRLLLLTCLHVHRRSARAKSPRQARLAP
jgi:hypothetical protein